jgi:N-acetylglucosamine kinase-like BadF-type ATPase
VNIVVVGVDIGGTSTRALATTLDGDVLGRGEAGGANPNSHPPEVAATRVAEAVRAAIGDPSSAVHCVLGMAGVSKMSDPAIALEFHRQLEGIGLTCPVVVVSDAEVAYASATDEPDGTVLVAGTGSIAAQISGWRRVRTVGGFGWLLGDEGSAFWLGREAVRTTLWTLQAGAKLTPLATAVLAEAGLAEEDLDGLYPKLITAANAEPPIRLARFAELVSEHAAADPLAKEIVRGAVDLLAGQAKAVRMPGETTPIVLMGSVAGEESAVGRELRAALVEQWGVPVLSAADGAAGAAKLAVTLLP